jgi:hypothetical protein
MWALRERTLAGLFHELFATEEAEERQVPIPQIELDPRGVWRACTRPLGEVDYPRLAPLEVYAPAAPGCSHRIFVSYAGSSYLFPHRRSLSAVDESAPTNFVLKLSDKSLWHPWGAALGGTNGAESGASGLVEPLLELRNKALLELSDSF